MVGALSTMRFAGELCCATKEDFPFLSESRKRYFAQALRGCSSSPPSDSPGMSALQSEMVFRGISSTLLQRRQNHNNAQCIHCLQKLRKRALDFITIEFGEHMKGILFSGEPMFGDDIKILVISPPGVLFKAPELGDHFYGPGAWHFTDPPLRSRPPRGVPDELFSTPLFRFNAVGLEWDSFLAAVYDSMDFVLFMNPETSQLLEVSQSALAERHPDQYAFTFIDITRNPLSTERVSPMAENTIENAVSMLTALLASGWNVAAISRETGINQITLGNIKNGKAGRVSDRVFGLLEDVHTRAIAGDLEKPSRGRGPAAGSKKSAAPRTARTAAPAPVKGATAAPASVSSLINPNYVSVDITQLQSVVDRLIENFSDAIAELQTIRSMITR